MSRPSWLYNRDDDRRGFPRRLADGVNARVFAGERSMLSLVRLEPRSEGPLHHHPEEQWGFLLDGQCIRIQDGREVEVTAGDFWHTPSNVPHGIRTGDRSALVLDVFSPPRAEYVVAGAASDSNETPALLRQALELGTACLSDAARRAGALPAAIRPLHGASVAGRAFTVACLPGDNLRLHRAVYDAPPGSVLVASTEGSREFGYWGDLLAQAAINRSLGGLVIDGCVRDVLQIDRLGFPIFATGQCILGTSKSAEPEASPGQPIRIGDCTISSGDLIVGDADGVVVIEADEVEGVLAEARRRHDFEEEARRRLLAGERTLEIFELGQSFPRTESQP